MKNSFKDNLIEFLGLNPNYNGTIISSDNAEPYFNYLKKHYCEKCGGLLEKKDESTIEKNPTSYATTEFGLIGTFKIVRYYFYCSPCDRKFTAKELKEIEIKAKKDKKRKLKEANSGNTGDGSMCD